MTIEKKRGGWKTWIHWALATITGAGVGTISFLGLMAAAGLLTVEEESFGNIPEAVAYDVQG